MKVPDFHCCEEHSHNNNVCMKNTIVYKIEGNWMLVFFVKMTICVVKIFVMAEYLDRVPYSCRLVHNLAVIDCIL